MGQDPGIWGTGDTYASNNSQNPFDFMPKFTRTNLGSGNHWSDGWENSDWNGWTGSDAYRAEKAYAKSSGGYEYGGTFKDGNDNQVKVVNGQLQVWYPMGGDLAYSEVGDGYVNKYYYGAWGDPIGGSFEYDGFGEYKEGLNVYSYLAGTSTTVNELYRGYEFLKAYNTDTRVALNRAFLGRFKGLSTNTLNKFADYIDAKAIGKAFSKPLLGVGIVLTVIDVYQNDFSASSMVWGAVDTGIAIAAIAVSGPAAPFVAVGATLYFTGRFAYGVYDAYKEGN